jgi:peroxiredoxin/outer membrane lipoprotein-sorting protein
LGIALLGLTATAGCQQSKTPPPGGTTAGTASLSGKTTPAKPDDGAKAASLDAGNVLSRMVTAYRKASSYSDNGVAHISAEADGEKVLDTTANFSVAFVGPNKVRVQAYGAEVVCDGKKMFAYVPDVPGQVMVKPAPERLTVSTVPPDLIVFATMNHDFAGGLPQIGLLFDNRSSDMQLLEGIGEPELLESGEFNGHACYRVKLPKIQGIATYWIDRDDFTLRRIVMPTDALRQELSAKLKRPISNVTVTADFNGAQLGGQVDPKAFQFELPADAKEVPFINPPHIRQLLGKKSPGFAFADFDGHPVASESTAGKTVVLMFWATQADECKEGLGDLEQLYQKLKNNPKLAFYAVNVDPAKYPTDELKKDVANLNPHVPTLRDPNLSAAAFNLRTSVLPCTFMIDAKGMVQHCENGRNPRFVESMQAKLKKVLAGEDIYQELQKQYESEVEEYRKYAAVQDSPPTMAAAPVVVKEELVPEAKTAAATKPTTLKLSPLWRCTALKSPGNIAVAEDQGKPARLLVIENGNSVAEVGLDGKVVGVHKLDLSPMEVVGQIRTAAGADGRRYVVAFLPTQKRCHVFDDQWNLVLHYPNDAPRIAYGGISDVQLGDLDGDGKLKMYVSYWAALGIQAVSLDGVRIWGNRTDVTASSSIAVGGADANNRRELYCTTERGSVAAFSAQGKLITDIAIRSRMLQRIVAADLLHNGRPLWCGGAAARLSDNTVVGFTPAGESLWSYTPPPGIAPRPIEPIIPGKTLLGSAGQWLLPGPDGSIHILAADGKLIDKFNYGAVLQGLATVAVDGRPVLVVATAGKLEALKIEQ